MGKRIEVKAGEKFGRWQVLKEVSPHPTSGNRMIYCQCQCGSLATVRLADMVTGRSKSCGCISIERTTTHGLSSKRLYVIWKGMLARCYKPTNDSYSRYGARGISVCEEWKDVAIFVTWAESNGYKDHLSIDRINSDGNYYPDNCRWVTIKKQQNNKSSNRILEHDGKKLNIAQWGELLSLNRRTISNRLRMGWGVSRALTTPVNTRRKSKEASLVR